MHNDREVPDGVYVVDFSAKDESDELIEFFGWLHTVPEENYCLAVSTPISLSQVNIVDAKINISNKDIPKYVLDYLSDLVNK